MECSFRWGSSRRRSGEYCGILQLWSEWVRRIFRRRATRGGWLRGFQRPHTIRCGTVTNPSQVWFSCLEPNAFTIAVLWVLYFLNTLDVYQVQPPHNHDIDWNNCTTSKQTTLWSVFSVSEILAKKSSKKWWQNRVSKCKTCFFRVYFSFHRS